MGWNQRCKKLRHNIFQGEKDHPQSRTYERKEYIMTTAWGHRFKRMTLISTGLHRQYRLLKAREK